MLLENRKIREFKTYPNLEIYDYICQFVKPDIFVIYNNDVMIYSENQSIEKLVKNIKFSKFISIFTIKKYKVCKYKIADEIFYIFDSPIEEKYLNEILKKLE